MSVYPQLQRGERLVPIIDRLLSSVDLNSRALLEALSADVVIRVDNARRLNQGSDAEVFFFDIRVPAHEVHNKSEPELERLIRSLLAA